MGLEVHRTCQILLVVDRRYQRTAGNQAFAWIQAFLIAGEEVEAPFLGTLAYRSLVGIRMVVVGPEGTGCEEPWNHNQYEESGPLEEPSLAEPSGSRGLAFGNYRVRMAGRNDLAEWKQPGYAGFHPKQFVELA